MWLCVTMTIRPSSSGDGLVGSSDPSGTDGSWLMVASVVRCSWSTAGRRAGRHSSVSVRPPEQGHSLPSVRTMSPRCDLVLPCRNEAAALPAVLVDVPADFGVIVVDNGSDDGTADVAAGLGARVVVE